jgi:hypothetical protein
MRKDAPSRSLVAAAFGAADRQPVLVSDACGHPPRRAYRRQHRCAPDD